MKIEDYKKDLIITDRLLGHELTLHATWGLFSPEKIDEGTRLLLDKLERPVNSRVLDLGCGYGAIGLAIAKAWPETKVEMVDKDFVAVKYAQMNSEQNNLPNAGAYLSNGFDQVVTEQFGLIVSNLPAKVSGELYEIWFNDAKKRLAPGGKLVVVTISGLREYIKRQFTETFGNYEKLAQNKTYTVSAASKMD
jgi:16S rRNA (guanine1207-N2)-methyltransferase